MEHPWWPACLSLDAHDHERAARRLQEWQRNGIATECIPAILEVGLNREAGSESRSGQPTRSLEGRIRLDCFGTEWLDWQTHAWLQRCVLPAGFSLTDAEEAPRIGLNLEKIEYWLSNPQALEKLSQFTCIWDPDLTRVRILRALGNCVEHLHTALPCNGWLDRDDDTRDAMLCLGLPDPRSLAGDDVILVLGKATASQAEPLFRGIYEWPGFDAVQIAHEDSARLLAHWMEHCSRLGIQIVRLKPTDQELRRQGFASLSLGDAPQQLCAQFFHGELHLSILREELEWRRNGRPAAVDTPTPSTSAAVAWETSCSDSTSASVCISLYNYQQTIVTALESAKRQSQAGIELIIVDDASTDQSLETTRQWLQANHQFFSRALLLQHASNAGLAAARNTAFAAASADWCFVLDADNQLHPHAVEECLKVARYAAPEVAVIHPLIQVSRQIAGHPYCTRSLISGQSWQAERFRHENYIDAMAMIRKAGWSAVNGYSHIEDGWEDYDFWCKLIGRGFHGVLCPQALATYLSHEHSMIYSRTDRNVRRISRLLQARHPWLDLPMAREDA